MRRLLLAAALTLGFAGVSQAAAIYTSIPGVNVNGTDTPNLSAVSSASFSITLDFDATPGGGGGILVDEVNATGPSPIWHNSQIEVESNGHVRISAWGTSGYQSVGILDLGIAAFGTNNAVAVSYDAATETLTGSLNGIIASMVSPNHTARIAPSSRGATYQGEIYAFGRGDTTNLNEGLTGPWTHNEQGFVGTITNVTIYNDAETIQNTATPVEPVNVPEPAALTILGTGLLGIGAAGRRKARAA